MAAPGKDKTTTCEKCFARISGDLVVCPECGAPLNNASTAEAEAAVYPDIARANLARMRGDYKSAEDQLLAILRRYPNNPSANEMLGDLYMEREDPAHALQWYELALEIVPESTSIARKLKDARAKIDQTHTEITTAQLELPDPASRMPLFVTLGVVLLAAVAIAGYLLGRSGTRDAAKPPQPLNVITAAGEQKESTPQQEQPETKEAPTTPAGEDAALLQILKAKGGDTSAVLGVTHDPRAGSLVISFAATSSGDRALAAKIARDASTALPTYALITLKGLIGGKVVYMADVSKASLDEVASEQWKTANAQNPDSWIDHVLTNEWPTSAQQGTTSGGVLPSAGANVNPGDAPPGQ